MAPTHIALTACHLLLLLLLAAATNAEVWWTQQRDDPSEYTEVAASFPVMSDLQCLLAAADAGATAATVSASGSSCSLLRCRLGEFGCRKCRNARNSSLPAFWMRKLSPAKFCWRTFQHRVDASVDFYRNWTQYVSGFGQGDDANFWMGLEQLHQLTKDAGRRVRWEFSDWNGTWNWVENPNFSVAGASDKYRASMGSVDSSRSTLDQYPIDHKYSPNGKMFSTGDSDNDIYAGGSCAAVYQSAWWFGQCAFLNPNGRYYTPTTALNTTSTPTQVGIYYFPPSDGSALRYSRKTFECLLEDSL